MNYLELRNISEISKKLNDTYNENLDHRKILLILAHMSGLISELQFYRFRCQSPTILSEESDIIKRKIDRMLIRINIIKMEIMIRYINRN